VNEPRRQNVNADSSSGARPGHVPDGRLLVVMDVDSTFIREEVIELVAAHAGAEAQAEVAAVTEAAILIVRGTQPVTWTDGELVSTALAILVPAAEAGSTHLELLAKVARGLMDDEFRETLISGDVDTIYQRVDAQLNS